MKISTRLRTLRDALGLTQPDAAIKFHMPLPSWKSYEKGPSEPGSGALRSLAEGGVNVHWLLTGEGSMLLNDAKEIPPHLQNSIDATLATMGNEQSLMRINLLTNQLPDKITEPDEWLKEVVSTAGFTPPLATYEVLKSLYTLNNEGFKDLIEASVRELARNANEFAMIPFYDQTGRVKAKNPDDQDYTVSQIAFSKYWLKSVGLQASKCALIRAINDSMEPTIKCYDQLWVDTSYDYFKVDGIYALKIDRRLIVRRIQVHFDYTCEIICDNQRYENKIINPEQAKDITIVGLVKWYSRGL